MEVGPSRVTRTTSTRRRRVEDVSRVKGEASHVITKDSVIDSVVGETVTTVELAAVP